MITYKRTKIKCPEVPEYKNDAVTGYEDGSLMRHDAV
jgi:hypothetical protein